MQRKNKILIGAGGGFVLLAAAAAAMALAPDQRGPKAADLNGDGQIVAQEIAQGARQKFAELDADKDGKLTGAELPRRGGRRHHDVGPRAAGDTPEAEARQDLPAPAKPRRPMMDANADGAVTLPEFYASYKQRLSRADANGDGTISAEELNAMPRGRHGRGHGGHR